MNTNNAVNIVPEPYAIILFGAISTTFAKVGTPRINPARIMHIINDTNVTLEFSIDGLVADFTVSGNGFLVIDFSANKSERGGVGTLPANTQLWVRSNATFGAAASGWVTFSTWYGRGPQGV